MAKRKTTRKSAARRRAVTVHGLSDALRAASIAHEHGVAITLFSAPGAVASIGPAWFRDMVRDLERAYPGLDAEAVLDCGDMAGYALAALRSGIKIIRFSGRPSTVRKIEDIAGAHGARLVRRPPRILDPRRKQDADAALRQWLGGRQALAPIIKETD